MFKIDKSVDEWLGRGRAGGLKGTGSNLMGSFFLERTCYKIDGGDGLA